MAIRTLPTTMPLPRVPAHPSHLLANLNRVTEPDSLLQIILPSKDCISNTPQTITGPPHSYDRIKWVISKLVPAPFKHVTGSKDRSCIGGRNGTQPESAMSARPPKFPRKTDSVFLSTVPAAINP